MSEENKEKLKEYQKNIAEVIKAGSLNLIKTFDFADLFYQSMHCFS